MKLIDENGKQYWKLEGLEVNDAAFSGTHADTEQEIESQAEQLYRFIYNQIPAMVGQRLTKKLNDSGWF